MTQRYPDPIWPERWRALSEAVAHARVVAPEGTPYRALLEALGDFGAKRFAYFYTGFASDLREDERRELVEEILEGKTQSLQEDGEYGPDFVMRRIVDSVAYDLELMQRAYRQRQGADSHVQTLNLVDAWARDLLQQFADGEQDERPNLLLSTPRVVSYFATTAQVRLVPYADAVFVGIPHTAASAATRRDLLVGPHELGHYVYRHGHIWENGERVSMRDSVARLIEEEEPFVGNWIEEIFADVFAITAIPRKAKTAMVHWVLTMIRDNAASSYWKDSATHPVDAARMFIFLVPANLSLEVADALRSQRALNAEDKGEDNGYVSRDKEGNEKKYGLQELRDILELLLNEIGAKLAVTQSQFDLDELRAELHGPVELSVRLGIGSEIMGRFPAQLLHLLRSEFRWGMDVREPSSWYADFETTLEPYSGQSEKSEVQPWLLQAEDDAISAPDLAANLTFREGELSADEWKKILFAGDWISKGAQTGPTGIFEDDWTASAVHS